MSTTTLADSSVLYAAGAMGPSNLSSGANLGDKTLLDLGKGSNALSNNLVQGALDKHIGSSKDMFNEILGSVSESANVLGKSITQDVDSAMKVFGPANITNSDDILGGIDLANMKKNLELKSVHERLSLPSTPVDIAGVGATRGG